MLFKDEKYRDETYVPKKYLTDRKRVGKRKKYPTNEKFNTHRSLSRFFAEIKTAPKYSALPCQSE